MPDVLKQVIRFGLFVLLASCQAAPPPPVTSLWGDLITLAEAEQSQAPALWVQPEGILTAAWVGSDSGGVHQDARVSSGALLGDSRTLPLPPVHPYAQTLLPGTDDRLHLLWLDADEDGIQHLYAALLGADLTVERGPTPISDRETLRYTAQPVGDGSVLILWSGGPAAEPALFAQRIDARGLPREPVRLAQNADWPTLARANDGTQYVLWLTASDTTLHAGILQGDQIHDEMTFLDLIHLGRGDRLHDLTAGLDATHLYLFWNVTPLDGQPQTWMTARALAGGSWSGPQRLGVGETHSTALQTGFNSGAVNGTGSGEGWLHWAAPLAGQFDLLPVAGAVNQALMILYFQAGQIVGGQRITLLRALLAPPVLQIDRDRYLYLAWSEPGAEGRATLNLTTSRH